ncbi:MAG TPA: metallophosphoesterase family protein [Thermomicrobiales bacterium]|nr:metallophosphoesterase family protein [Thermomicrobiales bacterium]
MAPPRLGRVVGLFADVHGATGTLGRALALCREAGAETVALLGDLFDRAEQADPCALALAGWPVVGVYGNHERELALAAADHRATLRAETVVLLNGLREEVVIEDIRLLHEARHWGHQDPLARLFGRGAAANGHGSAEARITFAGHTHYRHARDERGPLDIARGALALDPARRYLINPGALAAGQFAVWDREARVVYFKQIER